MCDWVAKILLRLIRGFPIYDQKMTQKCHFDLYAGSTYTRVYTVYVLSFTSLVFHLVYTRSGSLHSAAIQELLDPRVTGPNILDWAKVSK